jgi:sensor domain CHASE-containing protein
MENRWGCVLNKLNLLFERRNFPAWLALLFGLAMTLFAWNGLRVQTGNNAQQQFLLHARDVLDSIENRMHQHEQILRGAADKALYKAKHAGRNQICITNLQSPDSSI